MEQPNYYGILPAPVRYHKEVCASAKVMFAELSALTQKEGYCWASNNYFANIYDVEPTTVSAWVKQLATAGFITFEVFPLKGNLRKIWITGAIVENRSTSLDISEDPSSEKPEASKITSLNNKNENHENALKLYEAYPKKTGKLAALKAIRTALKTNSFATLQEAVTAYAEAMSATDKQFIPHPATWFNGGRWMDDRTTWAKSGPTSQPALAFRAAETMGSP